jgi:hypothetical protein
MKQFNMIVDQLGLTNFHYKKPLIDGKEICKLYQVAQGKIVGHLNTELARFEILNPSASVDDCLDYLELNKTNFLTKY